MWQLQLRIHLTCPGGSQSYTAVQMYNVVKWIVKHYFLLLLLTFFRSGNEKKKNLHAAKNPVFFSRLFKRAWKQPQDGCDKDARHRLDVTSTAYLWSISQQAVGAVSSRSNRRLTTYFTKLFCDARWLWRCLVTEFVLLENLSGPNDGPETCRPAARAPWSLLTDQWLLAECLSFTSGCLHWVGFTVAKSLNRDTVILSGLFWDSDCGFAIKASSSEHISLAE